ncbi:MAG TPA: pro-sigmaK processing inhibitor BofA [Firmicutes bacterium]|nr:pro-sigmaK processing inhibitor BofA [Bacillota bacterium]HOQ24310.1 pro-sigmaK processing inhibitor BofA family protein [Bacillota bacterium]HPT67471.1 pro-sigmaK processing inhibitor BofA family protein [Bacillota bacterium]
MKGEVIAVYLAIVLLIFLGGRPCFAPVRWLLTLLFRGALGAGVLALVNLIGGWLHFMIPLNPYTAIFVGYLGLPGMVTLLLLNRLG